MDSDEAGSAGSPPETSEAAEEVLSDLPETLDPDAEGDVDSEIASIIADAGEHADEGGN